MALERINQNFFGGDTEDHKSTLVVSWEVICKLRNEGGLRIYPLKQQNRALLAKLGWRLSTQTTMLWRQVLQAKYGIQEGCEIPNHRGVGSYTWKSLR